jgi:hypothetical protein
MRIDAAELRSPPDRRSLRSLRPVTAAFACKEVVSRPQHLKGSRSRHSVAMADPR